MKRKDLEGLAELFGNQVAVLAKEAELVGRQEARIAGLIEQMKYRDAQVAKGAKMLADAQAIIERGACAFEELEVAFFRQKPESEEDDEAREARANARNNAWVLLRRWKADGRKWCMELGLKIGPIT